MEKLTVCLLFGGASPEHRIALLSAKNVMEAIDDDKFNVVLVGIDQQNRWFYYPDINYCLKQVEDPQKIALCASDYQVCLLPSSDGAFLHDVNHKNDLGIAKIDIVFPILHGKNGEDGTMQGLLALANVACVGADVLASAICMDKDITKRLLNAAGIAIAPYLVAHKQTASDYTFDEVIAKLGLPFFIKPANAGSSVGVAKVKNATEFTEKLQQAFQYDNKVLLEQCIVGRELECAVLGNEKPIAALPGEIITRDAFYSYYAKYLDDDCTTLVAPAELPSTIVRQMQQLAVQAFKVLGCSGMARVDFFLTTDNKLVINEINTIPGFTNISMYPRMWATSGISYPELIEHLISLAFAQKHNLPQPELTPAMAELAE